MNVLLINANREQMPWPVVPIGLCLVASALRRAGHDVDLLDLAFSGDPFADTRARVERRRPAMVGISVRNLDNCNFEAPIFYLPEVRDQVVGAVRRAAPSATIVVGGSAVSVAPFEVLRFLGADLALAGEGEGAAVELAAALERGASERELLAIPGVVTAAGDRRTVARVADVDAVRAQAWRWIDLERYAARGGPLPVQTKRGCAQRCSYCVYNAIEGRSYRLRRPAAVADEIEEAVRDHGVRAVELVDSTFNLPHEHCLELCAELASRALPVELSTMGLNPGAISQRLLGLMRRAGFESVMCAPESASDATLAGLDKGYRREAVVEAATQLRRAGLRTFWFFMLGAPGETLASARETLEFCADHLPPTDVVLLTTGLRVYPGTPLAARCRAEGWFAADDPLLAPSWYVAPTVDVRELYRLLVQAVRRHPSWMLNAETILAPPLAALLKRSLRLLGRRGPFWTHLPQLMRWRAALGARGRTLEAASRRLEATFAGGSWAG
jgi:radical SAM superfamily enzyme YgiQ (UPF0313 family)